MLVILGTYWNTYLWLNDSFGQEDVYPVQPTACRISLPQSGSPTICREFTDISHIYTGQSNKQHR